MKTWKAGSVNGSNELVECSPACLRLTMVGSEWLRLTLLDLAQISEIGSGWFTFDLGCLCRSAHADLDWPRMD